MIYDIPPILTSDKILDRAFKKTKKVFIVDRNALYKKKKTIIAKTESFATNIISILEEYVKKFPSIDNMHPFYKEILIIKTDLDKLKNALGAVDWAKKTCQSIYTKQSKSLFKSKNIDFLIQKQNEIYGRISSVVKQINNELLILSDAQKILKYMPCILDVSTVVIAGYPNVGKSSILKNISNAKPEIAQYPFTTKEIFIGHIERKIKHIKIRFQIIDTPGLLDTSLSDKNDIEKQALAALKYLAEIILFVIDSSETSGYPLEHQLNLLTQTKKMFKDSYFIIVENKTDIKKGRNDYIKISCKTGEGIELLKDEIFKYHLKK
jgi:nucleolar GTP-binding protein